MDCIVVDLCSEDEEEPQEPPASQNQKVQADCHLCGQTFGTVSAFMNHMRSYHRLDNLFDCEVCHQIFLSEAGLEHHRVTTHAAAPSISSPQKTVSCELCGDKFHHAEALEAHKDVHTIEKKFSIAAETENLEPLKKFSCPICLKNFFIEEALINHRQRKHFPRNQTFVCDICRKAFASKKSLVMHRQWHFRRKAKTLAPAVDSGLDVTNRTPNSCSEFHHKQKPNPNSRAGAPCPILKSKSHLDLESNEAVTVQKELDSNISDSESAVDSVQGVKTYSCNKCGSVHSTKISLRNHRRQHILQTVTKNDANFNLKIHELTHTLSPLICPTSEKPFPGKISLEEHKIPHESVPAVCKFCQKRFSTLKKLNEHIRVKHSKKIGWRVESDKNNLKLKISSKPLSKEDSISHGKKKRRKKFRKAKNPVVRVNVYECKFCEKNFMFYYSYLQHLETHPITKKFSCSECNQTFGYSSSLKSHILVIHTKSRVLFCANCLKPFDSKLKYSIHWRSYCSVKDNKGLSPKEVMKNSVEKSGIQPEEEDDFSRVSLGNSGSYFSCRICQRLYAYERHLLQHLIFSHLPEEKFMLEPSSNSLQQSLVPVSSSDSGDLITLIQHFEDGKSSETLFPAVLTRESNSLQSNQSENCSSPHDPPLEKDESTSLPGAVNTPLDRLANFETLIEDAVDEGDQNHPPHQDTLETSSQQNQRQSISNYRRILKAFDEG